MNLSSLVDRNLEEHGTYDALIFEGRTYTNEEMAKEGFRLAGGMAGAGIEPGDRVVVMLPNSPEVVIAYMGGLRTGAVVVPVLFLLAPAEIHHILVDSGARMLITSPEFLANAHAAAEGLDVKLVVTGEGTDGAVGWSDLVGDQPEQFELVEREGSDPALLMYTSGTTGKPKGVVLTHANMLFEAEAIHEIAATDPEKDVGLGALPQAHAGGLAATVIALKFGTRSVLLKWFTPEAFFDAVEQYGVTTTALVPTMMTMLLEHPDAERRDLSTLTEVGAGAAPCPTELVQAFEKRFGVRVLEVYGLTEAAPLVTANRRDLPSKPGSAGPPLPGVEVRIVGPDGQALPAGEPGEITVSGPCVMAGYWHNPEATAEAIRDGWLYTGDIGYLDGDGYLYLVDREKDLIIRGGQNIYPRDAEEVLHTHPDIAEAAVVGTPDPTYGEQVTAFVVPSAGKQPDPDEVISFCRERLAKYKCPASVHVMGSLPRNAVGKVLKRELRDQLGSNAREEVPDSEKEAPEG